ncbi:3D domain-containing protein, partial [Yersinia enterocolitica]
IKGQHFDIYQGIGHEAGQAAGFYNHYGRVWVLKNAQSNGPLFTAYQSGKATAQSGDGSSLLVRNQGQ